MDSSASVFAFLFFIFVHAGGFFLESVGGFGGLGVGSAMSLFCAGVFVWRALRWVVRLSTAFCPNLAGQLVCFGRFCYWLFAPCFLFFVMAF